MNRILETYYKWVNDYNLNDYLSESEKKKAFLCDVILDMTTYDMGISIEIGEMVLETLIQIKNRTTFEYIKDATNYKNYILSCQFIMDWLNWGTSIRGAWFDTFEGVIGHACGEPILLTEDLINPFIDWLQSK